MLPATGGSPAKAISQDVLIGCKVCDIKYAGDTRWGLSLEWGETHYGFYAKSPVAMIVRENRGNPFIIRALQAWNGILSPDVPLAVGS